MRVAPIFIHSGWRTGGTFFIDCIKKVSGLEVFYDPLNQHLINFEAAQNLKFDSWHSNHPEGFDYFSNYSTIYEAGYFEKFPELNQFKYRNSDITFQKQLIDWLQTLIESAWEANLIPVFKTEQLLGHIPLFRSTFPGSIHIALTRNSHRQYISWLEQSALGNNFFFDQAVRFMTEDRLFFNFDDKIDLTDKKVIFEVFHSFLSDLATECDLQLNLDFDSLESIESDLRKYSYKSLEHRRVFEEAIDVFKSSFHDQNYLQKYEKSLLRQMHNNLKYDELTVQRDELTVQRDELTVQRDELIRELDVITSSTIWRMTAPLRALVRSLRGLAG